MTQERDIVDELREIQRMNTTLHGAQMAARAADDIERLRGMLEVQDEMVKHYVEERDAQKAEADHLARSNALLVAEIETLREERDEARVEVCRLIVAGDFSVHENETKEHVAFERGWDCFKEKP
jgi:dephospho-CoA kinase